MLKKSKSGFSPHILLPIIAAIAVIGIGGYLAKHYYDVSQERKEFMAAKAEVNKLGEAIAKETNPTKHQAVQYCDYGHAKWGPVGRTCWVRYYAVWEAGTTDGTVDYYDKSIELLSAQRLTTKVTQDGSIKSLSSLRSSEINISGFPGHCSVDFYKNENETRFDKMSLPGLPFETSANSAIMILGCSGDAMAEHFPVRKS